MAKVKQTYVQKAPKMIKCYVTYNIIQIITNEVTELFSLRTKIFTLPALSTKPIPYRYSEGCN